MENYLFMCSVSWASRREEVHPSPGQTNVDIVQLEGWRLSRFIAFLGVKLLQKNKIEININNI